MQPHPSDFTVKEKQIYVCPTLIGVSIYFDGGRKVAGWWVVAGEHLYQGDEVYLDHIPPPALWGVFGKANARIVDPYVDSPKLGN